ncbi:MAG: hypothetical protein KJO07_07960, partial [Deltaproteobacteria bacterium]|nr:hypothetical protein [Deltaproteobacteria bacterium]
MRGLGPRDKTLVNAVDHILQLAPRDAIRRLAGRALVSDEAERVRAGNKYRHDLAAFLNRLRRADLDAVAEEIGLEVEGKVGELRARIWRWGAER